MPEFSSFPDFPDHPEFTEIARRPVYARVFEKRSPVLAAFLKEHGIAEPKSVEYAPLSGCRDGFCFVNVEQQISKMGGSIETGWVFWEYVETSISTEAHAIWISPQGKRRDITPREVFPDRRILFTPDPRVAKKRGYTASVRTILSNDSRVIAMESFAGELAQVWEEQLVKIGTEMEVPIAKLRLAAKTHGLPWPVAQWMIEKKVRHHGGV